MLKKINKIRLRYLKKMTFLPPELYASYLYEYFTGKKLDLKNPIEFNAKIQWYKVYYHPKELNQYVDKYEVREYVAHKIGEKYLNKFYGIYDSYKDVDFNELPNKFVIKGVHASSYNLICEDKSKLNEEDCRKLFKKWQSRNQYYRTGQEWAYRDVKPRLMVEKILNEDGRDSLTDYKFYCFGGKVKFVEVHLDRSKNHLRGFYDLNFKKLDFRYVSIKKSISEDLIRPANFDEMIELAGKLSEKLPFVRIDFYSIKGESIFGEMTFYPSDGRKDFYPDKYNKIIGDYFVLPEIKEGQKYITTID